MKTNGCFPTNDLLNKLKVCEINCRLINAGFIIITVYHLLLINIKLKSFIRTFGFFHSIANSAEFYNSLEFISMKAAFIQETKSY